MTAPGGMSMPVNRMPTTWRLEPSSTNSRSELLTYIEPFAPCSTSSFPDTTRRSMVVDALSPPSPRPWPSWTGRRRIGDPVGEAVRAGESGSRRVGEGAVAVVDDGAAADARRVKGGDGGGAVALIVVGEHIAGGDGGVEPSWPRLSPTASGARSMAIVATAVLEFATPSLTVTLITRLMGLGVSLVLLKETWRRAAW